MKVPFLPKQKIEQDAEELLEEFSRAAGKPVDLPIPIDDIVEKYLKIGIELDDTHQLLGIPRREDDSQPDVLGAIFFDERSIVTDDRMTAMGDKVPLLAKTADRLLSEIGI